MVGVDQYAGLDDKDKFVAKPNPYRSVPLYVNDGDRILVPYHNGGVVCRVICSAGTDARVVNKNFNIDKWIDIRECRVECEDP